MRIKNCTSRSHCILRKPVLEAFLVHFCLPSTHSPEGRDAVRTRRNQHFLSQESSQQPGSGSDEFMVRIEVFAPVFVFTPLGESGSPVA